jgi:hypothetical protein
MACSIRPIGNFEILPGGHSLHGRDWYRLAASFFAAGWELLCRYRYAFVSAFPWTEINTTTDENRDIVVKDNYTLAVLQYFLNPDLVFVAIPVIYNICMDFGEDSYYLHSMIC